MSLDDIDLDSWKEKKEEKPQGEAPAGDSSGSTASSTRGGTTGDTSGNTRAEEGVTSGATRGPRRKSRVDRETMDSRSTDIPGATPAWKPLDPDVLAEAMRNEPMLPNSGYKEATYWLLHGGRNKRTARTSALNFIIKVMRKLWGEGYR